MISVNFASTSAKFWRFHLMSSTYAALKRAALDWPFRFHTLWSNGASLFLQNKATPFYNWVFWVLSVVIMNFQIRYRLCLNVYELYHSKTSMKYRNVSVYGPSLVDNWTHTNVMMSGAWCRECRKTGHLGVNYSLTLNNYMAFDAAYKPVIVIAAKRVVQFTIVQQRLLFW